MALHYHKVGSEARAGVAGGVVCPNSDTV